MAKQVISKAYDSSSDTWTEVYRIRKPTRQHPDPKVEDIAWPEDRDVWSAKELVCLHLGVEDVTASDLLVYIKRWREAGIIFPLYDSKLIRPGRGKSPSRYYAVRNAEQYTTPTQIRKALKPRGSIAGNTGNIV